MGYDTIPDSFYDYVDGWKNWYDGDVNRFHNYTVWTGSKRVQCRRYSLGMANKVSSDWANLLMNEKVSIVLSGNKEQAFLNRVLEENNFAVKASEMQEMKAALGTVAYIPRITNAEIHANGGLVASQNATIKLDYVTVQHIFPLSWENGKVKECAFTSVRTVKGKQYLYMAIHELENGLYVIRNLLFKADNGSLSDMTADEMRAVQGFENIPEVVRTGSSERQFVIDRLNIANNVDVSLPVGIPIFANAIDVLKGVDIAYDSYVNEFVLGKKRIMVKPAAIAALDGEPYFDPSDTTYYTLPEDTADGDIIVPIDMTLRTEQHNRGIQDQLNLLSSKCGLGETYYRFDSGSIATATQVISENSSMFRTIKKHEIILGSVLKELCRIILRLGNSIMGAGLNEDVEISIDFDDSIIEDTRAIMDGMRLDVAAGVLRPEIYIAKKYGVTEEKALKMMPDMMGTEEKQEEETL